MTSPIAMKKAAPRASRAAISALAIDDLPSSSMTSLGKCVASAYAAPVDLFE